MKVLVRVGIALLALVLSVGAAELLIRALDPHGISDTFNAERYRNEAVELCGPPRLFRHKPNVSLELRGFSVHTDSHGARGRELESPKPPGVERAAFVGDSVTFGWGVDEEDTFVARVAGPLSERTGRTWETVNLGHMFHDTTQELGVLQEMGPYYEPDLVVLVFVDNDVVPTAELFAQKGVDPLEDPNVSDEAKDVIRWSNRFARLRPYLPYVSALLSFEYVQTHAVGQTGSTEQAAELGMDVGAGWELSKKGLLAMRDGCAASGAEFCVLDYYRLDPLKAFCAENAIPYGSIAFTDEEIATGVRNSDADAHANARGHGYLAEHVLRELERLGLP